VRLQQLFPRIVAADYEQPRRVSEDCRALLRSMLTPDPNRRITIPEIMRHPGCVPPPRGAQAGEQTERPRGAPSGARAQVPDQPGAGQPGAQRPPGAARRADVDADGGRDRVDRGAGDHLRRPDRLGGGRLVRPAPPGRPARAGRARRADTRRAAAQAVVSSAAGPTGGRTGWVARRRRRALTRLRAALAAAGAHTAPHAAAELVAPSARLRELASGDGSGGEHGGAPARPGNARGCLRARGAPRGACAAGGCRPAAAAMPMMICRRCVGVWVLVSFSAGGAGFSAGGAGCAWRMTATAHRWPGLGGREARFRDLHAAGAAYRCEGLCLR